MKQQVDKVFYVNLDRREERRQQMEEQLEEIGFSNYERWTAVDGDRLEGNDEKLWQTLDWKNLNDNGDYVSRYEKGCYLSHLGLLKHVRDEGYESILILEDDAQFEQNFNRYWKKLWNQLPADWDMVYPGANDQHIGRAIGENLRETDRMFCTHSFMVNQSAYDRIISYLEDEKFHKAVDYTLADLHPELNVYVFKPHFIFQREDYSDIDQRVVNYDGQIRDLNK